jgi:hypothetical protein
MNLDDELELIGTRWYREYLDALAEQQAAEARVADCAARRAAALARLREQGWSLVQIAQVVHLTRSRVWQLIVRDRRNRA